MLCYGITLSLYCQSETKGERKRHQKWVSFRKITFALYLHDFITATLEKLSIIIPCYNEENFIRKIVDKVLDATSKMTIESEVIVIDDASTDQSAAALQAYSQSKKIVVYRHDKNQGKGAAIRRALSIATGSIVLIQDADLEYDPNDYTRLLQPILDGHADVVYGSRFIGNGPHRVLFYFHTIGNKFLTFLSNLFTQLNLTDIETGYKMFRVDILRKVSIREKRFGFEVEVTAKISRIKGIRIYETGIAYYGRTYKEGKKINWKDGFRAIYCIIKYNVFSRK
jgi:glycosyltransferase involved in cell wall biosynthesis